MNTEELKRLAEAASPGQWLRDTTKWSKHIVCGAESDHTFIGGPICETRSPVGVPGADPRCEQMREANAAYIAAANPAALLALIQQRDELLAALKDARELVDDWGAYAPAYMQEKHDLAGDLDRLYSVIVKAEAQS